MKSSRISAFAVFFLTPLFLISFTTLAQTGFVKGKVFEKSTDQALPGVTIFLESTDFGSATNGQGEFEISNIPVGRYMLVIRSIGFETQKVEIVVNQETPIIKNFFLIESLTELSTVTVRGATLTGGVDNIHLIPGSAHYISPRQMAKFNYNDINRVLNTVPGVNIQEEDGFGLRPNIGMRGTGVERSSKITLMEDGILTAPAPYAAPAAYYFPTVGRMQSIEVRKGSSQIKYGPYTTGGALNLISTRIPTELTANINLLAGSFNQRNLWANMGQSFDNFGFLLESFQANADGFKILDGGGNTGFDQKDYLAKLRLNTNPTAKIYQALTLKLGQSIGESNETYLGLTQSDFDSEPFRRYAASQVDLMSTEHTQYSAQHVIQPFKFIDITSTFYRNEFQRNWYKLDKVRGVEGSSSIGNILKRPDLFTSEYQTIIGNGPDTLLIKANNRKYYTQGFQSIIGISFEKGLSQHDIEIGLRFHKDEMDRFQWVDDYVMDQGQMQLIESGIPGTESNRIQGANAFASYIQYTGNFRALTLTPGIRFERVILNKEDYGKNDVLRNGSDLSINKNRVNAIIPGIGIDYRINEHVSTFFGLHKGFSPPGSTVGTKPESSLNYELGLRYQKPALRFNGVFYISDYSNLLGSDLAATGGSGTTDLFNGGEVFVHGVEVEVGYNALTGPSSNFSLPVSLAYTYTNAEFQNSFESDFEAWGTVSAGDKLPYLAAHRLSANVSFEHQAFNLNINTNYVTGMRTVASQGEISAGQHIDEQFVIDFSINVRLTRNLTLFGAVKNLTNQVYLVSRRPAGLRPGIPRNFRLGLRARF